MKSLETVQKIAKVLKILMVIGKVVSIVSIGIYAIVAGICLVAGITNNPDLIKIFMDTDGFSGAFEAGTACLCLCVNASATAVVFGYAEKYFKHELAAGTPFTFDGAKELMGLGIRILAWPTGAIIITSVICEYAKMANVYEMEMEASLGIAMILLSFVFRYGAELENVK